MAMALHLKPQFIIRRNPNITIHLLSSSSSNSNDEESNNNNNKPQSPPPQSPSPFQSFFGDVKASLRQTPTSPPPPQQQNRPSFSFSRSSTQSSSFDEIRKSLSQFRSKSAPESSTFPPQSSTRAGAVSFQELYKKNVLQKNERANNAGNKPVSFDSIKESLKQMRNNPNPSQGKLFNNDFRESLNAGPGSGTFTGGKSSVLRGGSETTPPPSFFRQDSLGLGKEEDDDSEKNKLVKPYSYGELGEKLRKLRPADSKVIGKNWLSFKELNERLVKLREDELKVVGSGFKRDLRLSLEKLHKAGTNKAKKTSPSLGPLHFLSGLGGTETTLHGPPKEHLVEKYFHPDNMSSAEKLKLELKKIRDEFKLSESDCGSSRVQVAQLTVKIKHLSSVLHKKDKHSRKGLQEMVQRRKKLLRYLRRTDWDSFCFCLDKLGLRDNPDYKH